VNVRKTIQKVIVFVQKFVLFLHFKLLSCDCMSGKSDKFYLKEATMKSILLNYRDWYF